MKVCVSVCACMDLRERGGVHITRCSLSFFVFLQ